MNTSDLVSQLSTSLTYTRHGAIVEVSNGDQGRNVLGSVKADGSFSTGLREWCDTFPHDAREAFDTGIRADAAIVRRVLPEHLRLTITPVF